MSVGVKVELSDRDGRGDLVRALDGYATLGRPHVKWGLVAQVYQLVVGDADWPAGLEVVHEPQGVGAHELRSLTVTDDEVA